MSFEHVEALARALLYEGWMLYPYRASAIKNQQRFLFGTLSPRAFAESVEGERWRLRAELVANGSPHARVSIEARGLIGDDEARIALPVRTLEELADELVEVRRGPVVLEVRAGAVRLRRDAYRVHVEIRNVTSSEPTPRPSRELRIEMATRSIGAAHALIGVDEGEIVSLLDPAPDLEVFARDCRSEGCFPVLVGPRERRDTMLASPIALGDYPRLAPESQGDFYDATEIDELLALRVRTLTDDEKLEVRASGAGAVLDRAEALGDEAMRALHGRLARPPTQIDLGSCTLVAGDRVRLAPRGRTDAFDLALAGRAATIASIEQEVDGAILLAVTVDDDPGADLGRRGFPGHRFFFRPEEVEPLS